MTNSFLKNFKIVFLVVVFVLTVGFTVHLSRSVYFHYYYKSNINFVQSYLSIAIYNSKLKVDNNIYINLKCLEYEISKNKNLYYDYLTKIDCIDQNLCKEFYIDFKNNKGQNIRFLFNNGELKFEKNNFK